MSEKETHSSTILEKDQQSTLLLVPQNIAEAGEEVDDPNLNVINGVLQRPDPESGQDLKSKIGSGCIPL